MTSIEFDDSQFQKGIKIASDQVNSKSRQAQQEIAMELLRLSQLLVPHDKGFLQNSSFTDWDGDDAIVVYNKSYAAYQHEGVRADGTHQVRNYSKAGRQSKFLEQPLKENIETFKEYYNKRVGEAL
jgi:hypothetical protein